MLKKKQKTFVAHSDKSKWSIFLLLLYLVHFILKGRETYGLFSDGFSTYYVRDTELVKALKVQRWAWQSQLSVSLQLGEGSGAVLIRTNE